MSKTVVAIFVTAEEAWAAAKDLFENGFLEENVDVSSGEKYQEDAEGESGLTRFFKSLFGTRDEKTERYSRVATKGYVVSVHINSEDEALDACEILDDNGAIDVNDHYNKYFILPGNPDQLLNDEPVEAEISAGDNATSSANSGGSFEKNIPANEEDVQVGTQEVRPGTVRVKSRIIENPVGENLRLREETLHFERRKPERSESKEKDLKHFGNTDPELTAVAGSTEDSNGMKVGEEEKLQDDIAYPFNPVADQESKRNVEDRRGQKE